MANEEEEDQLPKELQKQLDEMCTRLEAALNATSIAQQDRLAVLEEARSSIEYFMIDEESEPTGFTLDEAACSKISECLASEPYDNTHPLRSYAFYRILDKLLVENAGGISATTREAMRAEMLVDLRGYIEAEDELADLRSVLQGDNGQISDAVIAELYEKLEKKGEAAQYVERLRLAKSAPAAAATQKPGDIVGIENIAQKMANLEGANFQSPHTSKEDHIRYKKKSFSDALTAVYGQSTLSISNQAIETLVNKVKDRSLDFIYEDAAFILEVIRAASAGDAALIDHLKEYTLTQCRDVPIERMGNPSLQKTTTLVYGDFFKDKEIKEGNFLQDKFDEKWDELVEIHIKGKSATAAPKQASAAPPVEDALKRMQATFDAAIQKQNLPIQKNKDYASACFKEFIAEISKTEHGFYWNRKPIGFFLKDEAIEEIAAAVAKENSVNPHPLCNADGDFRTVETIRKLTLEKAEIEPKTQKDKLIRKNQDSLRQLLQKTADQIVQAAFITPKGKVDETKFALFYEVLGTGNQKVITELMQPLAAAKKAAMLTEVSSIRDAIAEEMGRQGLTLTDDSRKACQNLFNIVDGILLKTRTGAFKLNQSASLDPAKIPQLVRDLKKDYNLNPVNHPLGHKRFEHALKKLLIDALEFDTKKHEDELRPKLSLEHLPEIERDIPDYGSTELKEAVKDLKPTKENPHPLAFLQGVLGKGNLTEYQDAIDLIGKLPRKTTSTATAKTAPPPVAPTSPTTPAAKPTTTPTSSTGKKPTATSAQPATPAEEATAEKQGFAAATTSTKMGMVGTAVASLAALIFGAKSKKKEEASPDKDGKPQEEKSNFWPNVAMFLGVVGLIGTATWAYRVSRTTPASGHIRGSTVN